MSSNVAIELSNYRFEKAQDLLSQAVILFEKGKFDGSINRSYYSIFNSIRSLLALRNLDSSKHSGVLAYFDRYFVKTRIFSREFSKIAHSAFNLRQDNDYEDFYRPSSEDAEHQIEDANKFLQEVEIVRQKIIHKEIDLPNDDSGLPS